MKNKIKINPKKLLISIISIALLFLPVANSAYGMSYNYDFWKNVVPSAEGFSFQETYYGQDIFAADDSGETASLSGANDMTIYNGQIFVLSSPVASVSYDIPTGKVTTSKLGNLLIMNSKMQWTKKINEFVISNEVKDYLDKYYNFDTPLDKITPELVTHSELMVRAPYVPYSQDPTRAAIRLNDANGITVTSDGIYIADTGNARIIRLNFEYEVVNVYLTPEDTAFYQITSGMTIATTKQVVLFKTGNEENYKTLKSLNENTVTLSVLQGTVQSKLIMYQLPNANSEYYTSIDDAITKLLDDQFEGIVVDEATAKELVAENKNLTMSDYQFESDSYEGEIFMPTKIAVDQTGRVYAISKNIYEGIIEYNKAGLFNRYLGKNEVVASPWKKLWGKIFTETQISQQKLDLPPLFTNISIDEKGFIYATSYPDSDDPKAQNMVKAINTSGKDVMKRNGYVKPDGDAVYITATNIDGAIIGSSNLVAVDVSPIGNYTVVDNKRGRLFTYDSEGNLLYVTGEQPGGVSTSGGGSGLSHSMISPVSVKYMYRTNLDKNGQEVEEELMVVLDSSSQSLLFFETTEFGEQVNLATKLYQTGEVEQAEEYWRNVIKMNTNYELAFLGIGKSLMRQGEYSEAMVYFKQAHSSNYYGKAFGNYRDEFLQRNFDWIMTSVVVVVLGITVLLIVKNEFKKKQGLSKGDDE